MKVRMGLCKAGKCANQIALPLCPIDEPADRKNHALAGESGDLLVDVRRIAIAFCRQPDGIVNDDPASSEQSRSSLQPLLQAMGIENKPICYPLDEGQ